MVQDYIIHRFIREQGGKATKKQIFEAFGSDKETRRRIEEKLMMMDRFGLVVIDGEEVKIAETRR